MKPTILLAGGGTGGHVYPLVAVADALRRVEPSLRIVFVGTKRGIETRVVPSRGYELELVRVEPIRGMGAVGALRGLWSAAACLPGSYALLRRLQPAAVLTVGGYAAGPISLAARAKSIPLALLEPNAVMGLANRAIAPLVSRAYTAFPDVERHFGSSKILRCGVPIREGFRRASFRARPDDTRPDSSGSDKTRILVLGGSQGARTLNDNVPEALGTHRSRIVVRHQCGQADVDRVKNRYIDAGILDAEVTPFIDDMPAALSDADLVISRSGASAVSEICAVGRASILVPFPYAAGNHQQRNAESLANFGAARWVHNSEATPQRLEQEVGALIADWSTLSTIAERASALGRPDAAEHLARDLLAIASDRGYVDSFGANVKTKHAESGDLSSLLSKEMS